jgi:hypothetical protein
MDITSPSAAAFKYHLCNSHILVGSISTNSGHIRGSPIQMVFLLPLGELGFDPPLGVDLL